MNDDTKPRSDGFSLKTTKYVVDSPLNSIVFYLPDGRIRISRKRKDGKMVSRYLPSKKEK